MSGRLCPYAGGRARLVTHTPVDFGYNEALAGEIPARTRRIRVKCPICARRLIASISVCDDGCCIYHRIPPHKPRFWWKPSRPRGAHGRRSRKRGG